MSAADSLSRSLTILQIKCACARMEKHKMFLFMELVRHSLYIFFRTWYISGISLCQARFPNLHGLVEAALGIDYFCSLNVPARYIKKGVLGVFEVST